MPRDPRWLQIGSLAALLVYGVAALNLEVRAGAAALVITACLAVQWLGTRLVRLPAFEPKSALISALSLALLLRTSNPLWLIAVPVLTIGSKFVLRVDDRHVFNPTNFGLAAAMLASDQVWVSPGQWGSVAITAFAAICLGSVVVRRAERSDVTWAFLAAWVGLLLGRALWLGDPLAIPLHQLSNGALLIFAFFMISDPKTTPDSRAGRVLFACLVASVAYVLRFEFFDSNALIWALAGCSPLVPIVNHLLAGKRYEWPGRIGRASGAGEEQSPPLQPLTNPGVPRGIPPIERREGQAPPLRLRTAPSPRLKRLRTGGAPGLPEGVGLGWVRPRRREPQAPTAKEVNHQTRIGRKP